MLARGRALGLAASVVLAIAVGYGATRLGSGGRYVAHERDARGRGTPQMAAAPAPETRLRTDPATSPPASNAPTRAPQVERGEPFVKPAPSAGRLPRDARAERAEVRAKVPAPSPNDARADTAHPAPAEATVRAKPSAKAMANALADSAPASAPASAAADLGRLARRLGERPREIEGLALVSGTVVPGATVAGADSAREVVRLSFRDSAGRIVTLEQQRADAAPDSASATERRTSNEAPRAGRSAAEQRAAAQGAATQGAATRAAPGPGGRADEPARRDMAPEGSPAADAATASSGWWRDGALRLRLLAPLPGDSLVALRARVR
jgi:hypothetical protein